MINNYQEQQKLAGQDPPFATFATIGAVYSDGVSLIFDGQTAASAKHYKVNRSATFSAGDRVKVAKISGTYIAEYPVGNPS